MVQTERFDTDRTFLSHSVREGCCEVGEWGMENGEIMKKDKFEDVNVDLVQ
jgi:hypothetical protein